MKKITYILGWPARIVSVTILIGLMGLQDPPIVYASMENSPTPTANTDDAPNITGIEIVSSPAANNTYGVGEIIEFAATFSTNVDVNGNPALGLWVGSSWQSANYLRGSGTNILVFGYEVKSGDSDDDGVRMGGGFQDSNGQWHNFLNHTAVTAVGTNTVAHRAYDGISDQSGHKVDGSIAPFVTTTQISSTPASYGTYRKGENIEVKLTFNAPVYADGGVIALRVGDDATDQGNYRAAGYASGSGTKELIYRYTVRTADFDTTGVSVDVGGSNSGFAGTLPTSSTNSGSVEVSRNYPGTGTQSDHKVNGQPYVTEISITSTPTGPANTYGRGEFIQVSITFDQEVDTGENASAILVIGSPVTGNRQASYVSGSGTSTLVFKYRVQEYDRDDNGVTALLPPLDIKASGTEVAYQPNPGGIRPVLLNDPNHKVNGNIATNPKVRSISILRQGATYTIGDTVGVVVTFNEDITVTGTPQLELDIGDTTKTASYTTSYGDVDSNNEAVFIYTVQEGDSDSDGISIGANKLSLNEGTIKDGDDNDADLQHGAVTAHSINKVDGVYPTVSGAATSTDGKTITLTFSENIAVSGQVNWLSEFLGVDQSLILIEVIRVTVAGIGVRPHSVSISGTDLILTLDTAITQGQTVTVSYILGHVSDILTDTAGNALSAFTNQEVTNNSTVAAGTIAKGVVLNPTDLRIDEGQTGTYTVALATQPTADVTVTISSSSHILSADPTSLTFTTANWNTAQTVTLTSSGGTNDFDYWVRVTHTASGGEYDSVHGDLYVVIESDHE